MQHNITVKAISSDTTIAECVKTENSEGSGEFKESLNFNGQFNFVKDCTGNGDTLIVPEFNITKDFDSVRVHGGKDVNVNQSGRLAVRYGDQTEEEPEYHYFQYEFYLRSKNRDLYLDTDSMLVSMTEVNGDNLFDPDPDEKKSAYGNNCDGLVGAIRVGLTANACTGVTQTWTGSGNSKTVTSATSIIKGAERQLLWDPRPDVHLNITPEPGNISTWYLSQIRDFSGYHNEFYQNKSNTQGLDLIQDDSKSVISTRMKTFNRHQVACLQSPVNINVFSAENDYDESGSSGGKIAIAPDKAHTDQEEFEEYYITKYTMKVWIEGTDHEARRAMDGGEFKLVMQFR